ncbi:MAG: hypothetical protein F6K39_35860 [Okeania sp. SIO3B3]|nr:hypothetical protein [Okeania sp. SIO3B3]
MSNNSLVDQFLQETENFKKGLDNWGTSQVFKIPSKFEGEIAIKVLYPFLIPEIKDYFSLNQDQIDTKHFRVARGHYIEGKFLYCLRWLKESTPDNDCPICEMGSRLWSAYTRGDDPKVPHNDETKKKITNLFAKDRYIIMAYVMKISPKEGDAQDFNGVRLLDIPKTVNEKISNTIIGTIKKYKERGKNIEMSQFFNQNAWDFVINRKLGGMFPSYDDSEFITDDDLITKISDDDWAKAVDHVKELYPTFDEAMLYPKSSRADMKTALAGYLEKNFNTTMHNTSKAAPLNETVQEPTKTVKTDTVSEDDRAAIDAIMNEEDPNPIQNDDEVKAEDIF